MTQLGPFPDESDGGGGGLHPEMAPLTTFASAAAQFTTKCSVFCAVFIKKVNL